jgi:hypothetical protein
LRSWIKRLERNGSEEEIAIPQADGGVERFSKDASIAAFAHEAPRMKAVYQGEDPGEPHPLTLARRNALHPPEGNVFDADKQPRSTGTDGV